MKKIEEFKKDKKIKDLNEINGVKFKVMWSTRVLYNFLGMSAFLLIMFLTGNLVEYGKIILDFEELLPLIIVSGPIFIFLNFINRKFIGKVVAVINEKGIYTKDGVILWNKIKEIRYKAQILPPTTRNKFSRYCYLTVSTDKDEYRILHAPHKMIKHIKKHIPNVKVKRDNESIITIILIMCISVLGPIIDKFKN